MSKAQPPENPPTAGPDRLTRPTDGAAAAPADRVPLPGQHPDVTPDFVFGHLAASAETTRELARAMSGVQHNFQLTPRLPRSGAPVTVQATTGPACPAAQVWLYYTTDGRRPAGRGGQAQTGTALAMEWRDTRWADLLWDYLSVWEAVIPAQPAGTYVRYQIEAIPVPGSGRDPVYADVSLERVGYAEPVFAYLVDAPGAPDWARSAVIYQIYLDRFNPGTGAAWRPTAHERDLMGGTLRGVTEKLDYIAALGANTIWLTPLFHSPSYHRYDAADLFAVDPALGSKEDLRALVDATHARGMRILLDIVANHVSNQHPYFRAAQADAASPYHDWFTWTHWPDEYVMFFTSKGLPRFNNEHPAARAHMLDAIRYWMEQYGVDGYRLDYVLGPTHDFWTDYYRTVKGINPDSFSVAEATHGAGTLRTYEGRMDGALDFTFLSMIRGLIAFGTVDLSTFDRFLTQTAHFFSPGFVLPTFLDNHDMNRFLWVAKGDKRKLEVAAAIQFTLAPPPIVYYGTEVGIRQKGDVRNGGYGRDVEARGPMLWGADQDTALLAYYQRLGAIRQAHPVIWQGTRRTLHLDNATGTYAYLHTAPALPGLLTLANLSPEPRIVAVTLPGHGLTAPRDLLNGHPVVPTAAGLSVPLPPRAAALIALDPGSH